MVLKGTFFVKKNDGNAPSLNTESQYKLAFDWDELKCSPAHQSLSGVCIAPACRSHGAHCSTVDWRYKQHFMAFTHMRVYCSLNCCWLDTVLVLTVHHIPSC